MGRRVIVGRCFGDDGSTGAGEETEPSEWLIAQRCDNRAHPPSLGQPAECSVMPAGLGWPPRHQADSETEMYMKVVFRMCSQEELVSEWRGGTRRQVGGAWLTQLAEHVTRDPGAVSSSPTLGGEIT